MIAREHKRRRTLTRAVRIHHLETYHSSFYLIRFQPKQKICRIISRVSIFCSRDPSIGYSLHQFPYLSFFAGCNVLLEDQSMDELNTDRHSLLKSSLLWGGQ